MAMPPKYFMYFPGNYRWFDACVTVGDEVRSHAERFAASGHTVSAAAFYLRACHYYQMGERFRTPKDKSALDAYRISVDCFHRFAALTDVRIETVEVPFEDKSLPGYFVHAQNRRSARAPCVVFFDGLDFLEKRGDVDGEKIGIVAISLGGYYAPRCAALEPRFAACIAWGAIWDYHAVWRRRIEAQFKASLSVPGHHIMWILGAATLEDALKRLEPFKLDGVVQKMRCPFLVVHGEDDEQIPLSDARALYDACGSKDKTLRVFTSEEGGAQHCQRDYLTLGCATMWSWFEDKLVSA